MNWAIKNKGRILATPKHRAICPLCNDEVIAKCGEIKIWHWSHKANFECDSFKEPETKWHFNWKDMFKKEMQEIIINKEQEIHRADIKNKEGLVIEFQNSFITPEQIKKREYFYKNMIWILNGDSIANNFGLINKQQSLYGFQYKKGFEKYFDWKWFPKSWSFAKKPILIDISSWNKDNLFKIEELDEEGEGYGILISKTAFIVEKGGRPWLKENDTKTIKEP